MAIWPEVLVVEARGLVDEMLLQDMNLLQVLEKVCYNALLDNWELWLCIIDEVVSRLQPFPAIKWPLRLHFLVLQEHLDTQDTEMLVCTVDNIKDVKDADKTLRPEFSKQLDHFCDLLRLRATLLAAVQNEIKTVEELSMCIEKSVNSTTDVAAEMIEKVDESNFNIEEATILAEKALRTFAGKVQKIAFFHSSSQADEIQMPESKHIWEAAKFLQADFPEQWLQLAIKKLTDDLPRSRGAMSGEDADMSPPERARADVGHRRRVAAADPKPVLRVRGKNGLKLKP